MGSLANDQLTAKRRCVLTGVAIAAVILLRWGSRQKGALAALAIANRIGYRLCRIEGQFVTLTRDCELFRSVICFLYLRR
jgi:hypothetical protein